MKKNNTRRRLKKKYRRLLQFICFILILSFIIHKKNEQIKNQQAEVTHSQGQKIKESSKKKHPNALQTDTFVEAVADTTKLDTSNSDESNYLVNIYQTASTNSKVIDALFHGGWAQYLGTEGDYYKIQTDSQKTGYVEKNHAQLQKHTQNKEVKKLSDLTIVLDPGHGGEDVGSLDRTEKIYEKTLTLKTALTVQSTLKAKGINVIMTRTKDEQYTPLNDISKMTNRSTADLLISFHYDNYDFANQATGFTTYYFYEKSKAFATEINTQLSQSNPLPSRGVQEGNYMILRETYPISILLELGFMNNDKDLATMNTPTYRQTVADSILKGITTYYHLSK